MSETRGLYQMLMLALIFNIVMLGIFDFLNSQNLTNINCDTGSFQYNITNIDESDSIPQQINHCEPEGLPWWFYAIWIIIDGVLIYAFVPFVK